MQYFMLCVVSVAPGIPRAKSSRSLNRAKSKEGSQQRRQNMDKVDFA